MSGKTEMRMEVKLKLDQNVFLRASMTTIAKAKVILQKVATHWKQKSAKSSVRSLRKTSVGFVTWMSSTT